jgi:hypothetical protein
MAVGQSRGADYMRGFTWGLKGEKTVMANLNKELEAVKGRSMRGLIMAAAFIRNETESSSPSTPVDLGNLRASYFVTTAKRVQVGAGVHTFKGPKASKMSEDHASVLMETQGIAASQSNKDKQILIMGYSANYGGYVHEMIGVNFQRQNPPAGPKWLEAHIKGNIGKIVQIVKENSQIKK